MRLIACPNCHAQYDVTHVPHKRFPCRCGQEIENRILTPVDAEVHRCGSCGAVVHATSQSCEYCGSSIVREPDALSLICPECYARNSEASRYCTACGVAFRPEPVQVAGDEYPCVCCGHSMPSRPIGGVLLNECPECHGLWVPGESFDALVNRAIESRRKSGEVALAVEPRVAGGNPIANRVEYRKCPVCGEFMLRKNFRRTSGVIIDRCNEHGTWLDANELEEIAGFILSGGMERAKAAEKTTMRAEKRETRPQAQAEVNFQRILMEHRPIPLGHRIWVSFADLLSELLK